MARRPAPCISTFNSRYSNGGAGLPGQNTAPTPCPPAQPSEARVWCVTAHRRSHYQVPSTTPPQTPPPPPPPPARGGERPPSAGIARRGADLQIYRISPILILVRTGRRGRRPQGWSPVSLQNTRGISAA